MTAANERWKKYYWANRDRICARARARAKKKRELEPPRDGKKSPHRQDALMRQKSQQRERESALRARAEIRKRAELAKAIASIEWR